MSKRDGYQPGVPCWIASIHPDPEAAVGFYTELLGWEAANTMPPGGPGRYFVCTLRGRAVAAIGSGLGGGAPLAAWGTQVWVDSADDAVRKVTEAGGSVLVEPFEHGDDARTAVVADPAGAVFGLWQPRENRGAQLVNEPGAWAMSALNTPDVEGAKAFYGAVFGWETDTFDAGGFEVSMWRVPGYVGGEPQQPVSREVVGTMMPAAGDDAPPPHWSVDFWVDDVEAAAARAAELGGRVVMPPFDAGPGRSAVLADPQGAAFSVSKVVPG